MPPRSSPARTLGPLPLRRLAQRLVAVGTVAVGTIAVGTVALGPRTLRAQGAPTASAAHAEPEPGLHVLSTPAANLVVLVRRDSAVVVGPPLPALAAGARTVLGGARPATLRFALVTGADGAERLGDGGWSAAGAVVFAHEALRGRLADAVRGTAGTPPTLPAVGFSEVVQLHVGGSDVHLIRQRPGTTAGDAIVHFEDANTVFLGNVFTSDGYPPLDPARGGSIDSMLVTLTFFRTWGPDVHFVPGRGPVRTVRELGAYVDMLTAVRDRVRRLAREGRSEAAVVAAHPTAAYDATWGRGPVRPDAFVAAVYRSVARR